MYLSRVVSRSLDKSTAEPRQRDHARTVGGKVFMPVSGASQELC